MTTSSSFVDARRRAAPSLVGPQYWSVADKILEVEGNLRADQWNGASFEDVVVCGLFRADGYDKRTNFESRLDARDNS